jgi:rhodanese-related sulfurtransferase
MLLILLMISILCSIPTIAESRPAAPDEIPGAIAVSAEELIKLVFSNPDIVLIDSRKKTEYIKGHIEGAINILNTVLSLKKLQAVVPDKTGAILFYCNGPRCLRSSDSVKKAQSWGYTNIFWFRGGWKEWQEKRFPIITG